MSDATGFGITDYGRAFVSEDEIVHQERVKSWVPHPNFNYNWVLTPPSPPPLDELHFQLPNDNMVRNRHNDELNNSAQLLKYELDWDKIVKPQSHLADPLSQDIHPAFPLEQDAKKVDVNFDDFIQDGDWVNESLDSNDEKSGFKFPPLIAPLQNNEAPQRPRPKSSYDNSNASIRSNASRLTPTRRNPSISAYLGLTCNATISNFQGLQSATIPTLATSSSHKRSRLSSTNRSAEAKKNNDLEEAIVATRHDQSISLQSTVGHVAARSRLHTEAEYPYFATAIEAQHQTNFNSSNLSLPNDQNARAVQEHANVPKGQANTVREQGSAVLQEQAHVRRQLNSVQAQANPVFGFQVDPQTLGPRATPEEFQAFQGQVENGETLRRMQAETASTALRQHQIDNVAGNIAQVQPTLESQARAGTSAVGAARSIPPNIRLHIHSPFDRDQGNSFGKDQLSGNDPILANDPVLGDNILPEGWDVINENGLKTNTLQGTFGDLKQFAEDGLGVKRNFEKTRNDHLKSLLKNATSVPSQEMKVVDLGTTIDEKSGEASNIKRNIAKLQDRVKKLRDDAGIPIPTERVADGPPVLGYDPLSKNLTEEQETLEQVRTLQEAFKILGPDIKLPPVNPLREKKVEWREEYAFFMSREEFDKEGERIDKRNAELDEEEREEDERRKQIDEANEKKRAKRRANSRKKNENRRIKKRQEKEANAAMAGTKVGDWDPSNEKLMSMDELDAAFMEMEENKSGSTGIKDGSQDMVLQQGEDTPEGGDIIMGGTTVFGNDIVSPAEPGSEDEIMVDKLQDVPEPVREKDKTKDVFATIKQRDPVPDGTGLSAPPRRPRKVISAMSKEVTAPNNIETSSKQPVASENKTSNLLSHKGTKKPLHQTPDREAEKEEAGTPMSSPIKINMSTSSIKTSNRERVKVTFVSTGARQTGVANIEKAAKKNLNGNIKVIASFDTQTVQAIVTGDTGSDVKEFVREHVDGKLIQDLA